MKHRTNRFTKANLFISLSHTPLHWSFVNSFFVYDTPSLVYTLHKLKVKIQCLFVLLPRDSEDMFLLSLRKTYVGGLLKIIVKTPNALLIVHVFIIKRIDYSILTNEIATFDGFAVEINKSIFVKLYLKIRNWKMNDVFLI